MIQRIKVTYSNIKSYVDQAWDLYQNEKTKFYPVIDQKEEMERIYKTAFMTDALYVLEKEGVSATLPILIEHESSYIQANGGLATSAYYDEFMPAFEAILKAQYLGYHFLVGYPSSNVEALKYHINESNAYFLAEKLNKMTYRFNEEHALALPDDLYFLDDDNVETFIRLHDAHQKGAYWTSDNILDYLERWCIVVHEDETAGAIVYEKFGINYAEIDFVISDNHGETILEDLLQALKTYDVDEVLYLIQYNKDEDIEILKAKGFKETDDYLSFIKTL